MLDMIGSHWWITSMCFGHLAYAHVLQELRGKFDDKAVKGMFVGHRKESKGSSL